LWQSFPRAPRAYLYCDDHSIIGSDFIVIEYRAGVVIYGILPESMRHVPDVGTRLGLAVVDAMADLHLIDPAESALEGLGRPEGFLNRQVAGWHKRWQLVAERFADDPVATLGDRLAQTIPTSPRPTILHNDFKIDNCQFGPSDPDRVTSVFDWDMATVGDPLVDLGTLLTYWPDPSDGSAVPGLIPGLEKLGLPTRDEVIKRYAGRTGIDVERVAWYEAYGCWKIAIILKQLHTRYLRGETADERMADRGQHIRGLAHRGLDRLAEEAN
jgi:aminoglycoside phosphotransferase (APT) family kinase protein